MKKNFLNILIGIIITLAVLVLIFLLFSVICPGVINSFVELNRIISNSNFIGCFLSGLLGALITGGITYLSLNNTTKQLQMDNQIKFRTLFSEINRWKIQLILFYISDLKPESLAEKTIKRKYLNSALTNDYLGDFNDDYDMTVKDFESILRRHMLDLYDYMGTFEIAAQMIKDGVLDENMFQVSYRYKLNALKKSETVNKELNDFPENWKILSDLLKK